MFASQVKQEVEFPDGSVTIRKLSWRSLDKAKEAKTITQAAGLRAYGGDIMKALRSEALDEAAKAFATKNSDPETRYGEYDREAVLVAGIDAWTYGDLSPARIFEVEEERAGTTAPSDLGSFPAPDRQGRDRGGPGEKLRALHQLLDEETPDDPDIQRLWLIALIADAYHVTPYMAARELDEDPEQLSLSCLPLLGYARAHQSFTAAKTKEELEALRRGSKLISQVERNYFDLRKERLAREKAEKG